MKIKTSLEEIIHNEFYFKIQHHSFESGMNLFIVTHETEGKMGYAEKVAFSMMVFPIDSFFSTSGGGAHFSTSYRLPHVNKLCRSSYRSFPVLL